MVTVNEELLIWLFPIFIPLMVLLFACREYMANKHMGKMFVGMFYGIGIYGSLILASYANDPNHGLGWFTEIISTSVGATLYEILIGIIGFITLFEFIIKKESTGFIAGVVTSFSIFEVYFAIHCVETIPFMDSILKHHCG